MRAGRFEKSGIYWDNIPVWKTLKRNGNEHKAKLPGEETPSVFIGMTGIDAFIPRPSNK